MRAKVNQQTELKTGDLEIIQNLCFMFGLDLLDRFKLNDDFFIADKIRLIELKKLHALVEQIQFFLCLERQIASTKLPIKAFLINGFKKPTAHFAIHIKHSTLNCITLIPEQQYFAIFVYFAVHQCSLADAVTEFVFPLRIAVSYASRVALR